MKKKIALFDLDHTILSVDSLISFVIYILQIHPYKIFYLPYLFFISLLRMFKLINIENFKSAWLIIIKGFSPDKLDEFSKTFINNKIIPKIKKECLIKINKLRKNNYSLILATASFEFYAKYISNYLKFDYFCGTLVNYYENNNSYKVKGKNCKGKEKIERIKNELDITTIDKINSYSYSDSLTDLPFLSLTDSFFLISKKKWKIRRKINQNVI